MFEAGFIDAPTGRLFYVLHRPARQPVRGAVLFVHPLGEELNKSRRMVALQARRLAERGLIVLRPDLFGCGDSAGEFAQARWEQWRADLTYCAAWLRAQAPVPLVLWGLRTGCLLAAEVLRAGMLTAAAALWWQPVPTGAVDLDRFLRLRTVASMMGGQRETLKDLHEQLAAGQMLEVAGYALHPELAAQWSRAELNPPPPVPIVWLEVSMDEQGTLAPASQRTLAAWCATGAEIRAAAVAGEPFWFTQEIREVPALLDATETLLSELRLW